MLSSFYCDLLDNHYFDVEPSVFIWIRLHHSISLIDPYLQSFELDFKKDDKVLGESQHDEGDAQPDPENQRTNAFGSGNFDLR